MKKLKKLLLTLVLLSAMVVIPEVEAISFEVIDEYDQIGLPMLIYDTGSKITVYDTEDYSLYAQWIEISKATYDSIDTKLDECNTIASNYNEHISSGRPNREDYDTEEEYEYAKLEYDQTTDFYELEYSTCVNNYYSLFPDYDDTKWELLENDMLYLPGQNYDDTKPFVFYVKLEDRENSRVDYEVNYLELEGKGEESEPVLPTVDDTNWKKLKTGIKKNETIEMFNNDKSKISYDESDSSKFIIKVEQEIGTYTLTLNYKDGVMTYQINTSDPEGYEFINSILIGGILEEYCKLYDYDFESFGDWLAENEGKLTLAGNGITYVRKEYKYEDEGLSGSISGDYFESLSINIAYPLTGYTNPTVKDETDEEVKDEIKDDVKEENEKNPSTGDLSIIAFAGTMLVCGAVAVVASRKTRLN